MYLTFPHHVYRCTSALGAFMAPMKASKKQRARVVAYMPPELRTAARTYAAQRDINVSEVVVRALKAYLDRRAEA